MSQQTALVELINDTLEMGVEKVFENVLSDPNATRSDFDALFNLGVSLSKFGSDVISRARMEEYNAQSINNLDSLEIEEEPAELEIDE